jgi:serine/threonine protein kinase
VEELTTVWQIGNEEITRLERIGVGGYGEVYRARYRDMTVAMKVLRVPEDDSMMREFEREIKFMQTVRHPNIVLFLGAGKAKDGSPFPCLRICVSWFTARSTRRLLAGFIRRQKTHVLSGYRTRNEFPPQSDPSTSSPGSEE